MGVQEGAWPKGKLRSEAVEEWIADEERRKKSIWYGKGEP